MRGKDYQFHSSSSSAATAGALVTLVGVLESGVITAPSPPAGPASSSSNDDVLRDMGDGESTDEENGLGVGTAVAAGDAAGEAQAFKND